MGLFTTMFVVNIHLITLSSSVRCQFNSGSHHSPALHVNPEPLPQPRWQLDNRGDSKTRTKPASATRRSTNAYTAAAAKKRPPTQFMALFFLGLIHHFHHIPNQPTTPPCQRNQNVCACVCVMRWGIKKLKASRSGLSSFFLRKTRKWSFVHVCRCGIFERSGPACFCVTGIKGMEGKHKLNHCAVVALAISQRDGLWRC